MLRQFIIIVGIVLVIVGLFWPLLSKIPLFRLPGDIVIKRPGQVIYIPITSVILISVVLSVLLRVLRH